jgi:hypothetical protein
MRQLLAVVLLLSASPTFAQSPPKAWIDVNAGVAKAAQDTYSVTGNRIIFGETATFRVDYVTSIGGLFDFGMGYMFTPVLGVGYSTYRTSHPGLPSVSVTIPHPNIANVFAADTMAGTGQLARTEGTLSIEAMVNATPKAEHLRVRIFGGPTYFQVKADTIDSIQYSQTYQPVQPINVVDISGYQFSKTRDEAWGYHVGTDVSYFFNRFVGVGGMLRFARGNVELMDNIAGAQQVKAGGLLTGGGLRLRF